MSRTQTASRDPAAGVTIRQGPVAGFHGRAFAEALRMALASLSRLETHINDINVFPVADGDTGTNMRATVAAASDAAARSTTSLPDAANAAAHASLLGARGNSGIILSQFLAGFAEAVCTERRLSARLFARACGDGAAAARRAIAQPKEGTLLTVIDAFAQRSRNVARGEASSSLATVIEASLQAANSALDRTPEELPVLAEAGVVDAGGRGFVALWQGVHAWLENGSAPSGDVVVPLPDRIVGTLPPPKYRYCAEYVVELEAPGTRLKAQLEDLDLGDSLVVATAGASTRVHIHTDAPEAVQKAVAAHGTVRSRKIDDMRAQVRLRERREARIALFADSTCDLPASSARRLGLRTIPVSVSLGKRTYADRAEISSEEIYQWMTETGRRPTTSQPSPGAFLEAFRHGARDHRHGLAILVSSATSGTFQAGLLAAQQAEDIEMMTVDSLTASGAHGLLVELAGEAIDEGRSLEEARWLVESARPYAHLFFTVDTMTYLIRSGRVGQTRGRMAQVGGRVPILTMSPEGRAVVASSARKGRPSRNLLVDHIERAADALADHRFLVCHAAAPTFARELADNIGERLGAPVPEIVSISPTLGTLIGPGAVGVALLGRPHGGYG